MTLPDSRNIVSAALRREREENQEAGRRLGAWYLSDRILDWEAFTVTIGD